MRDLLGLTYVGFLALTIHAAAPTPQAASVEFLQSLMQADGGYIATKPQNCDKVVSTLRATSSAIRAIRNFGGQPAKLEASAQFVARCQDADTGAFADTPGGKADIFVTAVGVMAAVEVGLPEQHQQKALAYLAANAKTFEDIRIAAAAMEAAKSIPAEVVKGWMPEILKGRNADGSYGNGLGQARETASRVALLARLGQPVEGLDGALKAIRAGQRSDGGFGKAETKQSDLETCYRVARALYMTKSTADSKALVSFVNSCRNSDGGYGVSPGQKSTVAATYYASTILKWFDK